MSRIVRRPCHYCGKKFETLTVDHIIPRSRGGWNASWNRTLACFACNQAKGNDWPSCACVKCSNARTKHNRIQRRLAA